VSPDEYTCRIRIFSHGSGHTILQVLLVGRVLDDGQDKCVEERQGCTYSTTTNTFDHLDFENETVSRNHSMMLFTSCSAISGDSKEMGISERTDLMRDLELFPWPQ
jgi:hypothetical protein